MVLFIFIYCFLRSSFALIAQAGVQWHDLGSLQPRLLGSSNSPSSASWVAGITGAHHPTQLNFVFLVETGCHHVGQAGLELLISWSAALASQSARNTGVSHRAQRRIFKAFMGPSYSIKRYIPDSLEYVREQVAF